MELAKERCWNRFISIVAFLLCAASFICVTLSGISCSFLSVSYPSPDQLLIADAPDTKTQPQVRSQPQSTDNEGSSYETYTIGILCQDPYVSMLLSHHNDNYHPSETTSFSYQIDSLWQTSQIFLILSLLLSIINLVLSLLLNTPILYPNPTNWKTLGIITAISGASQIPIFLIYDAHPCRTVNSVCSVSTGSVYMLVGLLLNLCVTAVTQCTHVPDWNLNREAWRRVTDDDDDGKGDNENNDVNKGNNENYQESAEETIRQLRKSKNPCRNVYNWWNAFRGRNHEYEYAAKRHRQANNEKKRPYQELDNLTLVCNNDGNSADVSHLTMEVLEMGGRASKHKDPFEDYDNDVVGSGTSLRGQLPTPPPPPPPLHRKKQCIKSDTKKEGIDNVNSNSSKASTPKDFPTYLFGVRNGYTSSDNDEDNQRRDDAGDNASVIDLPTGEAEQMKEQSDNLRISKVASTSFSVAPRPSSKTVMNQGNINTPVMSNSQRKLIVEDDTIKQQQGQNDANESEKENIRNNSLQLLCKSGQICVNKIKSSQQQQDGNNKSKDEIGGGDRGRAVTLTSFQKRYATVDSKSRLSSFASKFEKRYYSSSNEKQKENREQHCGILGGGEDDAACRIKSMDIVSTVSDEDQGAYVQIRMSMDNDKLDRIKPLNQNETEQHQKVKEQVSAIKSPAEESRHREKTPCVAVPKKEEQEEPLKLRTAACGFYGRRNDCGSDRHYEEYASSATDSSSSSDHSNSNDGSNLSLFISSLINSKEATDDDNRENNDNHVVHPPPSNETKDNNSKNLTYDVSLLMKEAEELLAGMDDTEKRIHKLNSQIQTISGSEVEDDIDVANESEVKEKADNQNNAHVIGTNMSPPSYHTTRPKKLCEHQQEHKKKERNNDINDHEAKHGASTAAHTEPSSSWENKDLTGSEENQTRQTQHEQQHQKKIQTGHDANDNNDKNDVQIVQTVSNISSMQKLLNAHNATKQRQTQRPEQKQQESHHHQQQNNSAQPAILSSSSSLSSWNTNTQKQQHYRHHHHRKNKDGYDDKPHKEVPSITSSLPRSRHQQDDQVKQTEQQQSLVTVVSNKKESEERSSKGSTSSDCFLDMHPDSFINMHPSNNQLHHHGHRNDDGSSCQSDVALSSLSSGHKSTLQMPSLREEDEDEEENSCQSNVGLNSLSCSRSAIPSSKANNKMPPLEEQEEEEEGGGGEEEEPPLLTISQQQQYRTSGSLDHSSSNQLIFSSNVGDRVAVILDDAAVAPSKTTSTSSNNNNNGRHTLAPPLTGYKTRKTIHVSVDDDDDNDDDNGFTKIHVEQNQQNRSQQHHHQRQTQQSHPMFPVTPDNDASYGDVVTEHVSVLQHPCWETSKYINNDDNNNSSTEQKCRVDDEIQQQQQQQQQQKQLRSTPVTPDHNTSYGGLPTEEVHVLQQSRWESKPTR